jgi:translocation and assembly module TamA
MTVEATERVTHTIGAGLAYNTSQGFGARAFCEDRNLFGNAENLRLSAEHCRSAAFSNVAPISV